MASILTKQIITNAKKSVDTYKTTVDGLYNDLNVLITNLRGSNFVGDASDGYWTFYEKKVVPAITENLTGPTPSVTTNIKSILESIEKQLLDTVDPQMGVNNKNS